MKRLTKIHKGSAALLLALGLTLSSGALPLLAAPNRPEKVEIVYGKLQQNGALQAVYVVNAFDLSQETEFEDYGDYAQTQALNGSADTLSAMSGGVRIKAEAGRYYYQGNLSQTPLPWTVLLRYTLDGKMVEASQLTGASGQLEIRLQIEANPRADKAFTDHYVLQSSFSFDPDRCTQINAPSATLVNAGQYIQANFMLLPGNKADYTITLKIRDFAMPGLTIAAVPLSLDFARPDLSEATRQLGDLEKGISELNDGVRKLNSGSGDLKAAAAKLENGANELADGGAALQNGLNELGGGLKTYQGGVSAYVQGAGSAADGSAKLLEGAQKIQGGLEQLSTQTGKLVDASRQIQAGLNAFASQFGSSFDPNELKALSDGSTAVASGLVQAAAAGEQLVSGLKTLSGALGGLIAQIEIPDPFVALTTEQILEIVDIDDPGSPLQGNAPAQRLLAFALNQSAQSAAAGNEMITKLSLLKGGLEQIKAGLDAQIAGSPAQPGLDSFAKGLQELSSQYAALDQGIQNMVQQLGQLPQLATGLNTMAQNYELFHQGLSAWQGGAAALAAAFDKGSAGQPAFLEGLRQLQSGLQTLNNQGTGLVSGASDLSSGAYQASDGMATYLAGIKRFAEGMGSFNSGLSDYNSGMNELAKGSGELKNETGGMAKKMEDEFNKEIDNFTGGAFTPRSFVSPRNLNIKRVQFVMMTEEIAAQEAPAPAAEAAPSQSLWDKFKALFGAE